MVRPLTSLLVAAAAASVWSVPAQAQPRPTSYAAVSLTSAQSATDVGVLRRALEEVHAGYDRYEPRRVLDTAFARLGRRVESPITDVELYREVALLLAKIRCSHTKAEYPAALAAFRVQTATHLPVQLRVFGSQLFADRSSSAALRHGQEILSINGVAAKEIVERLSRFAAVDGFTDFARAALLESDSDLMGSDLDQYWPMEFGFASSWTFVVRNGAAPARTVSLAPITFAQRKALAGTTSSVDFANGTRWTLLNDTTASLTIRSFVNYRTPVNADSLYGVIFGQLATRNVRHLVLDLRENGGGSDDASNALIAYLSDTTMRPTRAVKRRTIQIDSTLSASFDTWGDRRAIFSPDPSLFATDAGGLFTERAREAPIAPNAARFTGRVSVLVGRRNASATTMLLAVLQQIGARTGRLRLVGEETGGSAAGPTAGQILFLRLPNSGIHVRIPLKRIEVDVAAVVPGMGVFPDVDATETLADFRAGFDRALSTARTTPWRHPVSPLSPTVGLMRGVLEYRDYQGGKRVLLPTWQHTAPIGATGAFRIRTVYDDGPGKTIYSTDVVRVAGKQWIEGEGGPESGARSGQTTLRIASRTRTAEGETMVLLGSGTDDGDRVNFRYTVALGDSVFTRVKEFRQVGAAPGTGWQYRHEYRFRR